MHRQARIGGLILLDNLSASRSVAIPQRHLVEVTIRRSAKQQRGSAELAESTRRHRSRYQAQSPPEDSALVRPRPAAGVVGDILPHAARPSPWRPRLWVRIVAVPLARQGAARWVAS